MLRGKYFMKCFVAALFVGMLMMPGKALAQDKAGVDYVKATTNLNLQLQYKLYVMLFTLGKILCEHKSTITCEKYLLTSSQINALVSLGKQVNNLAFPGTPAEVVQNTRNVDQAMCRMDAIRQVKAISPGLFGHMSRQSEIDEMTTLCMQSKGYEVKFDPPTEPTKTEE